MTLKNIYQTGTLARAAGSTGSDQRFRIAYYAGHLGVRMRSFSAAVKRKV